ncbi:MAG: hypothetical protein O3A20_01430 [Planctomycetota bacterium]|nr:hypothetical protein [Planctomycetota bacterium]
MRNSVLLAPFVGLLLSGVASAQQDYDQNLMKANLETKVQKEFVAFGGWITDYDEARARAAKEGKLIFAYFTRSYSK